MGFLAILCWFACSCSVVSTVDVERLKLQDVRVSIGYQKTLDQAYNKFVLWSTVHCRPLPHTLPEQLTTLNEQLVDYIQFLFEENNGVAAGRHAILCMQNRFHLCRSQLKRSWNSVKSWEMIRPVNLRTPMPPLILECMFTCAMYLGFTATSSRWARDWISFGVGLIVSYEGLLRPGEWCFLNSDCICLPTSQLHGLTKTGLIRIRNGKNRRVFGREQISIVESPRALAWLDWLTKDMPKSCRLSPGGTARFRELFKQLVKLLRLDGLKLTPASLRAGGATAKFNEGMDLGKLQYRGRWSALSTLQHYIQEATASLVLLNLEKKIVDEIISIEGLSHKFESPPSTAWASFFDRDTQRDVPQWSSRRLRKRLPLRSR